MALPLHLLLVVLGALSIGPACPVSASGLHLPTVLVSDHDSASVAWLRQALRRGSRIRRSEPQDTPALVGRSMQGAVMMSNGLQRGSQPAIRRLTQCWAACNRQSSTRELRLFCMAYICRSMLHALRWTSSGSAVCCLLAELVQPYGYLLEAHTVQTEDGYLLGVFRMPRGVRSDASVTHR